LRTRYLPQISCHSSFEVMSWNYFGFTHHIVNFEIVLDLYVNILVHIVTLHFSTFCTWNYLDWTHWYILKIILGVHIGLLRLKLWWILYSAHRYLWELFWICNSRNCSSPYHSTLQRWKMFAHF
jgi:hypothetical protein